jgi:hypothetical protein
LCRQRTDRNDLGQGFLTVLAPGRENGAKSPSRVEDLPIDGRHRASRYEAEVNAP